jgi:hypothetical protein
MRRFAASPTWCRAHLIAVITDGVIRESAAIHKSGEVIGVLDDLTGRVGCDAE